MNVRISFLPAFFVTLAIAFAVAVVWRIGRYGDEPAPAAARESAQPAAEASGSPRAAAAIEPEKDPVEEERPRAENRTAASSQREQRFRELLAASPPPAVTGAQSQASQQAAANAARTAADTPSAQPAPQSQPGRTRIATQTAPAVASIPVPEASRPSSPSTSTQPPAQRVKEKDPTSDSTPPQLVSIQFTPPQVRDGEEIGLTVGATDDISGVRNISGSIVSPTGGLLGFALTRDPADPNRYGARVMIPREAPEGVWRINYLHMTDNASNPVVLSYNQGGIPPSGTFTVVSSRPDATPPVLRAIWLDRRAMKAGERNTIFVQAEDDKSGVALVSGVFHSPSRLARVGFGCRNSGTQWECDFLPPLSVDCGDWQLEQIQLQDKANNTTAMRGDNQLVASVKLNILSDQCDSEPPALLTLVLDTAAVSNVQDTVVTLTATVADDLSGVASVSGHMVGPSESGNAPRLFFSMSSAGPPDTWVGRVTVPKNAAKGIWSAGSIQMLDKANNLKIYTRSDPKLAAVQFRVE